MVHLVLQQPKHYGDQKHNLPHQSDGTLTLLRSERLLRDPQVLGSLLGSERDYYDVFSWFFLSLHTNTRKSFKTGK